MIFHTLCFAKPMLDWASKSAEKNSNLCPESEVSWFARIPDALEHADTLIDRILHERKQTKATVKVKREAQVTAKVAGEAAETVRKRQKQTAPRLRSLTPDKKLSCKAKGKHKVRAPSPLNSEDCDRPHTLAEEHPLQGLFPNDEDLPLDDRFGNEGDRVSMPDIEVLPRRGGADSSNELPRNGATSGEEEDGEQEQEQEGVEVGTDHAQKLGGDMGGGTVDEQQSEGDVQTRAAEGQHLESMDLDAGDSPLGSSQSNFTDRWWLTPTLRVADLPDIYQPRAPPSPALAVPPTKRRRHLPRV